MFEKRYRWNEIPLIERPGVYAIFADSPDALSPVTLKDDCLVYVGRTESTLVERNHFDKENSGFSSPRRSLGAILKDRLGLRAVPRRPGPSDTNWQNFSFGVDGEAKLNEWMREHLLMAIEPLSDDI